MACLTGTQPNFDSVWIIDHIDPNERFEMQGEIIKANDPILIRHHHTSVYLAADDKTKYNNDFGTEYEVYCCNHSTKNRSQNLALEYEGRLTSDVPTKFQEDYNVFFLQTAPEKSFARPVEELSKFDVEQLLKEVSAKIHELKEDPCSSLNLIFGQIDSEGSCMIDCDDFRWGLLDYGIQVTKDEAQEIMKFFDKEDKQQVFYKEFVAFVEANAPPKAE